MYVSRSVWSVSGLKNTIALLEKMQAEYESNCKQLFVSGYYLQWLHMSIRMIKRELTEYRSLLKIQDSVATKYENLLGDINAAIAKYQSQSSRCAKQRLTSIAKLQKIIANLSNTDLTIAEKYERLSRAIVAELNAVEADHNKDGFSKLFTVSRLAEAYMKVLCNNCIDPNAAKFSSEVELKSICKN